MSDHIEPFRIAATDEQLDDLKRRLRNTRWPEPECVDDWTQGIPLSYTQELCKYWLEKYDWRAREEQLNRFAQFRTTIDGLGIHFIHAQSSHPNAMPLVMTHGWPGSIVEFHKVIEPLTNPTTFGGDAADAFHVVAPSLPGYGFSDKPPRTGWNVQRIARAWRKYQTRPVTVINLVSEDTIEHRMLGLIDQKRALAEGVLDGRGDLTTIKLPSGRAAFMERLDAVLHRGATPLQARASRTNPRDVLKQHFIDEFDEDLSRLLVSDDGKNALAVVSWPPDRAVTEEEQRLAAVAGLNVHVIDPDSYETMRRLAAAGMISWTASAMTEIHSPPTPEDASRQRLLRASPLLEQARRKLQAATLLTGGGFPTEARVPAIEAAQIGTDALATVRGHDKPEHPAASAAYLQDLNAPIGAEVFGDFLRLLRDEDPDDEVAAVTALLDWIAQEIGA